MNVGQFLRKFIPYKEIGWSEIGEVFYRYTLVKTPWFRVYLHELDAPSWHPQCHDHPWSFVAFLIWGGYLEMYANGTVFRRSAGQVLFRPAKFIHNVKTFGKSWSLIITGRKSREWKFLSCGEESTKSTSQQTHQSI